MTSDDAMPRDPIELLMQEHRLIEQVLSALERYADAVAGGAFERDDLARSVLPAPAMHEVAVRCEAIERDYVDRGEARRLEQLATALAQSYAA